MDLVINLIGIITISCGGPLVTGQPDPCTSNFPKKIEVFIADGRFHPNPTVCKTGNTVDPLITQHQAYIRVRGAAATTSRPWPHAMQCDDDTLGKPCVLYPVVKRIITIEGVTDGPGVSKIDFNTYEKIRWNRIMPNLVLASTKVLARMTIRNGSITYQLVDGTESMIGARITVPNQSGNRVIRARFQQDVLTLTVPPSGTIDILNLPPDLAKAKVMGDHADEDDCDHFFLHYMMTTTPPTKDCKLPENACKTHGPAPVAGATLACSNSNYP